MVRMRHGVTSSPPWLKALPGSLGQQHRATTMPPLHLWASNSSPGLLSQSSNPPLPPSLERLQRYISWIGHSGYSLGRTGRTSDCIRIRSVDGVAGNNQQTLAIRRRDQMNGPTACRNGTHPRKPAALRVDLPGNNRPFFCVTRRKARFPKRGAQEQQMRYLHAACPWRPSAPPRRSLRSRHHSDMRQVPPSSACHTKSVAAGECSTQLAGPLPLPVLNCA